MDAPKKFKKDVHYRVQKHSERLGLESPIVDSAKNLYDAFHTPANSNARSDDTYALAAIYLAHRVRGEPTSTGQLVSGTTVNETYVNRAYRNMVDALKDQIDLQAFTPEDFIGSYADQLNLGDSVIERALEIHRNTSELTQNYANTTRAASALYLAAKYEGKTGRGSSSVTQSDLSRVSGVTEVTIRNRSREIKEALPTP